MQTLATLIDTHGVDVLEHLDREVTVPTVSGLQFQGDVAVVPVGPVKGGRAVPAKGIPVVRGEAGGNTHTLLADGPVLFTDDGTFGLVLGWVTVPDGATAYLAHPEHAYTGMAPGTYELRRQREQADVIRVVQD
jgi:hypothetical protein